MNPEDENNIVNRKIYEKNPEEEKRHSDTLTKEELKKLREEVTLRADLSYLKSSYVELRRTAIDDSNDYIRSRAKQEIERRILSGELKFEYYENAGLSADDISMKILSDIDNERRKKFIGLKRK